jgi:multiple antibiotic resistance protein
VDFLTATIVLLFIMDPFGNIPVFHSLLERVDAGRRPRVVLRELLFAYAVLLVFLFGGETMLGRLGLRESTLSIAGGLILFLIALGMVFPTRGLAPATVEEKDEEPFLVPLAVPLVAGPSSVAFLLLLVSRYPERLTVWLGALSLAWGITALILMASGFLYERIGRRGARAIERLIGMILIMMSVQMLLDGIHEYLGLG